MFRRCVCRIPDNVFYPSCLVGKHLNIGIKMLFVRLCCQFFDIFALSFLALALCDSDTFHFTIICVCFTCSCTSSVPELDDPLTRTVGTGCSSTGPATRTVGSPTCTSSPASGRGISTSGRTSPRHSLSLSLVIVLCHESSPMRSRHLTS